jgi:hypothetical protein
MMRNVHDALEAIRTRSGLGALQFDKNGAAELVFDRKISVNVVRIDETHLEFVTYLALPGFSIEALPLRALLHANYLGTATGGGRLALDPRDDELLYCERVDVSSLDEARLERRLLDFVRHAAFWRSEDANQMLGPVGDRPSTLPETDFIIRG